MNGPKPVVDAGGYPLPRRSPPAEAELESCRAYSRSIVGACVDGDAQGQQERGRQRLGSAGAASAGGGGYSCYDLLSGSYPEKDDALRCAGRAAAGTVARVDRSQFSSLNSIYELGVASDNYDGDAASADGALAWGRAPFVENDEDADVDRRPDERGTSSSDAGSLPHYTPPVVSRSVSLPRSAPIAESDVRSRAAVTAASSADLTWPVIIEEDEADEGEGGAADPSAHRVYTGGGTRKFGGTVFEEDDDQSSFGSVFGAHRAAAGTAWGSIPKVASVMLGEPSSMIGTGGNRGSHVYRLDFAHVDEMRRQREAYMRGDRSSPLFAGHNLEVDFAVLEHYVQEAIAFKLYPGPISANEHEFINTAFRLGPVREHILSPKSTATNATSEERRGRRATVPAGLSRNGATSKPAAATSAVLSPSSRGYGLATSHASDDEKMQHAAHHLVFPIAIVTKDGADRGLLMPLYDFNLKEFLVKHFGHGTHLRGGGLGLHNSRSGSGSREEDTEDPSSSAMLSRVRYTPIADMRVITAIAFQVLNGIRLLNHHMAHTADCGGRQTFTGFTHNDLHMDNILLSRRGRVALCDFELAQHRPLPLRFGPDGREIVSIPPRLSPASRQSPHGLFCESADTWAFGLLIIGLLTGVDPLFSSEGITNDFGNGPLLKHYSQATDGEVVLDWDSNIAAHVHHLLARADPSGRRAEAARSLLSMCGKCLANCPGKEPASAPMLLRDPVFDECRANEAAVESLVASWVASAMAAAPGY